MPPAATSLSKLYLLQLSLVPVPIGGGRTMKMVLGCYLIETFDGRHILIDTGIAPEAKPADRPAVTNESNVIEQLAALKLRSEDIDTVICTHFDVDHAGYHDAFIHSEFIVQRAHYDLARAGHPRLAAARSHWDHPSLRYRFVDGDIEILPGLALIETSGHVLGHQSVLLRLPNMGSILLAIDAVMMQRLFTVDRKAWPNDDDEEQLRASTRKLMELVQSESISLVVFGHDGQQWQRLKRSPDFYN